MEDLDPAIRRCIELEDEIKEITKDRDRLIKLYEKDTFEINRLKRLLTQNQILKTKGEP